MAMISFLAGLGWLVVPGLGAGGAGWLVRGAEPERLRLVLTAGTIVLAVMLASAALVRYRARAGPRKAAVAFLVLGILRTTGCIALTLGAMQFMPDWTMEFVVWVLVFYVTMLVGLSLWLARALKEDARRVALGEIDRAQKERGPRLGRLFERAL